MVCTKMDAAKGLPYRLAKQGLLISNLYCKLHAVVNPKFTNQVPKVVSSIGTLVNLCSISGRK